MKRILSDILIVAGCGLLIYGTYLVHPIAAVFSAGATLIILGMLTGLEAN